MRTQRWGCLALGAGLALAPALALGNTTTGDDHTQVGKASWYGREHAGHRTASGEAYDPEGLTAAHRTLPLGTVIEVSAHGQVVQVRVNDRGPFVKGRVLDLSAAAARVLGLDRTGTAVVNIRPTGAVCPANRACDAVPQLVAEAGSP
ncbi:septal ring lytic transglycosylase RlpA family protein [Nitrospirillum viridazoti]|uniref:Endolytic peptidoglycan transglycosylase RlpA n=1 Tax=Nitrospirillum viridazoti CBAmc TaxID=1441467 RepID=A0A248JPX1_9PROT|nr:septal ring lytic transglycosylase RlpA family protein [Nitrospirillum amazonense]ASG20541.1 septal ring lytic transglycosylase RlpA family lipoprotein [Nitrospirillum amazonense CBAmc]TWB34148.1 rare lipoprotein A [Nitrospirillum amazonense]